MEHSRKHGPFDLRSPGVQLDIHAPAELPAIEPGGCPVDPDLPTDPLGLVAADPTRLERMDAAAKREHESAG